MANYLRALKLAELSLVDRPANKQAQVSIFKRDSDPNDKGDDDMKTAAELQKEIEKLTADLAKAQEAGAKVSDLEKSLKEATDKLAEATASLAKAQADQEEAAQLATMSDAEKAFMASLPDDEARKAYRAKKPEERQKDMKKRDDNDEIIKVDGREVRKSAVGDTTFAVLKSQQERLEKQEQEIAKERERREEAEFSKRAADDLSNLPGEVSKKVDVLKAVAKMPAEAQTTLTEMLKAGDEAMKGAFKKIGTSGGKKDEADPDAFNKRVEEVRKRDSLSHTKAMEKARLEYPKEFAAYQEAANQAA